MTRSQFLADLRSAWPAIARDLVGVGGAGAIVYGVWSIHAPSGWIVGGMMLLALAVQAARKG